MRRLSRLYGAGPGHALLLAGSFVFAGYLIDRVAHASAPWWIGVWLAGAIVAHDLVLFPIYSLVDRVLVRSQARSGSPAVPWINHVRVPALVSGLLLLLTFPLVFRLSDRAYFAAMGLHPDVYLLRWLLITAGLFVGSGLIYLGRLLRAVRANPAAGRSETGEGA